MNFIVSATDQAVQRLVHLQEVQMRHQRLWRRAQIAGWAVIVALCWWR